MQFTDKDDGASINLKVGDVVQVALSENASTGYKWEIEAANELFDARPSKAEYHSQAIGAGGIVTFTFAAIKAGSGSIRIKCWRPWEGDKSIVKRFRMDAVIVP